MPSRVDSAARTGRAETVLWFLLVTAVIARLILPLADPPTDHLYSDPLRHWLNAERFFNPDLMSMMDPPVYQLVLMAVRQLSGDSPAWLSLFNGVLSASIPLLFLTAARSWSLTPILALAGAVVIGWHPSLMALHSFFMMETLLLPLLGLAALAAGRSWQSGSTSWFLTAIAIWTLTVLTKPTVAPLGIVLLLPGWLKHSDKLVRAGMALALAGLLMLPSGLRTQAYLGTFEPAGSPFIARLVFAADATRILLEWDGTRYYFASPSNTVAPLRPLSWWQGKAAREPSDVFYRLSSANEGRDWQGVLADSNRSAKVRLRQTLENSIQLLFSDSWPDSERGNIAGIAQIHARWLWAPLIGLCVAASGWLMLRRKPVPIFTGAAAIFALLLMVQPVSQVEGRYRKPLEPFLLLGALQLLALRRPDWFTAVGNRAKL